uniref:Reverse transcriptase domain-containing protein n=1 Tax=Clytia hemisphaerica TaxID=252671 RepID=A0A7M5V533_9CNID
MNLKILNEHIKFEHFKMSNIYSVLNMISKGCFMAKIDLKDAYYSVRIAKRYQKYLKFEFDNQLYQFTCFPNGLGPCPRKFTKIMKVPTSNLRKAGIPVCGYIDDLFTKSQSY